MPYRGRQVGSVNIFYYKYKIITTDGQCVYYTTLNSIRKQYDGSLSVTRLSKLLNHPEIIDNPEFNITRLKEKLPVYELVWSDREEREMYKKITYDINGNQIQC